MADNETKEIKEDLCMLHSSVGCSARGYHKHDCQLNDKARFASCVYRVRTTKLEPDIQAKLELDKV